MISLFITQFSIITSLLIPFVQDDSVKTVNIRVSVKEISVSYDSIFQARLAEIPETGLTNETGTNPYEPNSSRNASSTKSARNVSPEYNTAKPLNEQQRIEMGEQPIQIPHTKKLAGVNPGTNVTSTDTFGAEIGLKAIDAEPQDLVVHDSSIKSKIKSKLDPTSGNLGFDKLVYLWVGFILMLMGVIGGLVFNKNAFIISGVGVIFLLIGLYI